MNGSNPKEVGERSEAQIMSRFLRHQMVVLSPFGDSQRYDLVVEENGDFIRVQCKTALQKEGCFVFPTCSNNWNTKEKRSYQGEVDVFAVYHRELDEVFIFQVGACPNNQCSVRTAPSKNGQQKGIRLPDAHRFQPGRSLRDYP